MKAFFVILILIPGTRIWAQPSRDSDGNESIALLLNQLFSQMVKDDFLTNPQNNVASQSTSVVKSSKPATENSYLCLPVANQKINELLSSNQLIYDHLEPILLEMVSQVLTNLHDYKLTNKGRTSYIALHSDGDPGSDIIKSVSPQPLPLLRTSNRINIGLNPSLMPWNRQRTERETDEDIQITSKQLQQKNQNGQLLGGENSQIIQMPQSSEHMQEVLHQNHNEQDQNDNVIYVNGQLLGPHNLQGAASSNQHDNAEKESKDNVVYVEPTPNLVRKFFQLPPGLELTEFGNDGARMYKYRKGSPSYNLVVRL